MATTWVVSESRSSTTAAGSAAAAMAPTMITTIAIKTARPTTAESSLNDHGARARRGSVVEYSGGNELCTLRTSGVCANLALIVGFAADPGRSVGVVLLLPDRDDLFDPLNCIGAGQECLAAMWRSHGDHHAGFARGQVARAMSNRDPLDSPPISDLVANLREQFFRGFGI